MINSFGLRDLFSSTIELEPIVKPNELLFCLEKLSSNLHGLVKTRMQQTSIPFVNIGIKALVEVIEICENIPEGDKAQSFLEYIASLSSLTNKLDRLM